MAPPFILASASPRRKLLLAEAGYAFEVDPSEVDEPPPGAGEGAAVYCATLAFRKALAVSARRPGELVLAADTVGAVEGRVLNKPVDRGDAERMIRLQEGRDSLVMTAVCLCRDGGRWWTGALETSVVRFRRLSDGERAAFLDSGRWEGKAGAYGVQDRDPFVTVVEGSFSNVVGLPLERLAALWREAGIMDRST